MRGPHTCNRNGGVNSLEDKERKYRHEQKYCCTKGQFEVIRNTIKGIMRTDPHANADGMYHIRSLYFDDMWDNCWRENEDGNNPREKFRIRIYNGSAERINLELKRKENGKTQKLSCLLNRENCMEILRTGKIPFDAQAPPLYQKFYVAGQTKALGPKVIVAYDRTVYTYHSGNVRVTYDENISSCTEIQSFLSPRLICRPVMKCGQGILEVKYDEFLPDHVYSALQFGELREETFSKYYYCRKFVPGGPNSRTEKGAWL